MAGVFNFDTKQFEKFEQSFFGSMAKDKAAKQAGAEHVTLIQEAFTVSGVDPESGAEGAWPNKSDGSASILQDTGGLVGSINAAINAKGYTIGPSDLPYAAIHQFGGTIPVTKKSRRFLASIGFFLKKTTTEITMPARPYIVFPDKWIEFISEAYIEGRLGAT